MPQTPKTTDSSPPAAIATGGGKRSGCTTSLKPNLKNVGIEIVANLTNKQIKPIVQANCYAHQEQCTLDVSLLDKLKEKETSLVF